MPFPALHIAADKSYSGLYAFFCEIGVVAKVRCSIGNRLCQCPSANDYNVGLFVRAAFNHRQKARIFIYQKLLGHIFILIHSVNEQQITFRLYF